MKSPRYPLKYAINKTCEWNIHTRSPRSRILLQYPIFDMEGSRDGGKLTTQLILCTGISVCFGSLFEHISCVTSLTLLQVVQKFQTFFISGCPKAVLRIYTNYSGYPEYEICGAKVNDAKKGRYPAEILSQGNFVKLRCASFDHYLYTFHTTIKFSSEQGFGCANFTLTSIKLSYNFSSFTGSSALQEQSVLKVLYSHGQKSMKLQQTQVFIAMGSVVKSMDIA